MVGVNSNYSPSQNAVFLLKTPSFWCLNVVVLPYILTLLLSLLEDCILPYTCSNQTTLTSYLLFFLTGFLLRYFSPTVPLSSYLLHCLLHVGRLVVAYLRCFWFCCTGFLLLSLPSYPIRLFPFVVQTSAIPSLCSSSFPFCCTCLFLKMFAKYETMLYAFLYAYPVDWLMEKIDSQDMRMESMKLSDVSFTGISLEDSPRIIGTNIVFFSQGEDFFSSIYVLLRFGFVAEVCRICRARLCVVALNFGTYLFTFFCFSSYLLPTFVSFSDVRYTFFIFFFVPVLLYRFVPEDVMFFMFLFQSFGIFYLCSTSFRFCSTGLLLKASDFLCTGLRNMELYFMAFSTHILLIS
ncbi:hypothetical protein LXL04_028671 [Taraxacum kok-saghyz]